MNLDKFFNNDSSSGNTSRGLISGLIGGLAGTAVKSTVERFLDVRKIDHKSTQMKIIDDLSTKITGTALNTDNEGLAEQMVNIPIGVSIGAAYGYGKRDESETNIMDGVYLGATTWASTHESTLPLIGLEKSEEDIPIKTQLHELFAHVLFGVTTEIVRGYVNEKLTERDNAKSYDESDGYEEHESYQTS